MKIGQFPIVLPVFWQKKNRCAIDLAQKILEVYPSANRFGNEGSTRPLEKI